MIEIKLKRDYAVIKETLERIGIYNRKTKILTPSCYIIFKNNKYYIAHFKELLSNNNMKTIPQKDIYRRNAVATMLSNWNSIELVDSHVYQEELKEKIFVLSYEKKQNCEVIHKVKISEKYIPQNA